MDDRKPDHRGVASVLTALSVKIAISIIAEQTPVDGSYSR